jgi:hypothetical protein
VGAENGDFKVLKLKFMMMEEFCRWGVILVEGIMGS